MICTLGVDLGSSSCKAVLYRSDGHILDYQTAPYPTRRPQAGWAEQEPDHWLEAVHSVCAHLAKNQAWSRVSAVGISGQMHTLTLVDSCGQALLPAISWQDTRSAGILIGLADTLKHKIAAVTFNAPGTIMTLLPLLWIKEKRPQLLARARFVLLPKDYLRFKLTGQAATDPSDASGTALYSVRDQTWSHELISAFELPASLLPPIQSSRHICGTINASSHTITGIPPGIPVIAGGGDLAIEAVSAGAPSSAEALIRFGTAGAVTTFATSPQRGGFHCYASVEADLWMLVAGIHSCGSTVDWGRRNLLTNTTYEEIFLTARKTPPGALGLLFIPHLAGERAPYFEPNLRAHFVGLSKDHHRGHLIRALLEGVAFALRDAAATLPDVEQIRKVKLIGGQGEQPFWGQLLADVFNCPVQWIPGASPALGAAILAADVLGYPARPEMMSTEFVPRPSVTVLYEELFGLYRRSVNSLSAFTAG